mgnify:CR=1 FL=1|jgi:hypothetical protein
MQRNELNYWNGKVTNMRRDIEMQQTFNLKVVAENKDIKSDCERLKRHLEVNEAKEQVLARQIKGLEEDNERLVRMY